jgi:hypothetical protein
MTFTHALSTNNYGPAKFIVDASAANGTHTTIAAALTAASSGDTIFIRPGTYTENPALKAGVNLTAFGSDSSLNGTGKVIISGTCSFSSAGSVTISGIQLQTNSANLLAVTGSAASIVNLENCYLNCTNNTGISFTTTNAAAAVLLNRCEGEIGTTGITLFASSSTGNLAFYFCNIGNSGASLTASTCSAGGLFLKHTEFVFPVTTSGTSATDFSFSRIDNTTTNTKSLIIGGSGAGNNSNHMILASGTAVALTVTSSNFGLVNSVVSSTNATAVIDGAGTLTYSNLSLPNTQTITTTTQIGGTIPGGRFQAPSAGYLGEHIRSYAAGAITSTVVSNVTSISLTAGIWDVSAIATSASSVTNTTLKIAISANSASFTGTQDPDSAISMTVAASQQISASIPSFRVTLTATTTYYLVIQATFGGSSTGAGRISATRVG